MSLAPEPSALNQALDRCANEPIRLSGAIQPHGYLLSFCTGDWRVQHVSANAADLFEMTAEDVLGLPIAEVFDGHMVALLQEVATQGIDGDNSAHVGITNVGAMARLQEVSAHRVGALLHVELEPVTAMRTAGQTLELVRRMVASIDTGQSQAAFLQAVAEQARALLNYERVMVYGFEHDGSGVVLAESLAPTAASYMGQHFPAGDIPPQARTLYLKNRVRVIPDARYAPVPIVPPVDGSGAALDLSGHALRSVSPVHLEYLANMGVAASMSVSLVVDGQLWGLIACHHSQPMPVPPAARMAAELFGQFVSLHLASEQSQAHARIESTAEAARDALGLRLSASQAPWATLHECMATVQNSLRVDGVASYVDGQWRCHGVELDKPTQQALLQWASAQAGTVFASHDGKHWHPQAQAWPLAGVLTVCLGHCGNYLFGLRKERAQELVWAGRPEKNLVPTDDGVRIAPRRSFASWQVTVIGESAPFETVDLHIAERLHTLLKHYLLGADGGAGAFKAVEG